MKRKGVALVHVSLSLVVMMSLLVITTSVVWNKVKTTIELVNIEAFVTDAFLGMQVYYSNHVTTSGCYNLAPPTLTISELINSGFLSEQIMDISPDQIDSIELNFLSNTSTGKVETMQITIPSISNTSPYTQAKYLQSSCDGELTFRKNLEFSTSELVTNNITSSFCKDL